MSKWKMMGAKMMVMAVLTGMLSGCGSAQAESASATQEQSNLEPQSQEQNSGDEETKNGEETQKEGSMETAAKEGLIVESGKISIGDTEVSLDADDEYISWDENSAVKIELNDSGITVEGQGARAEGSTLIIDQSGTYILKGTLSDGTVLVDADDEDKVRLVFDGVNIHSETSAAVDIKSEGKTVISLAEGSVNRLSDSPNLIYRDEEKEEPNGALFCKGDLTINGSGTLKVEGTFNNGIGSKDVLKIVGGTFEIDAANHGLKGNDALVVYGGQFTITATGDGMKSDVLAAVLGGEIFIGDCEEGLEAETVAICGGSVDLTARDDGINASTDEDNTPKLYFTGGTVTVRAEGDGIDSNGSIYMSGGQVTVYGPSGREDGAIDYDGEFYLTGGVLAAFGPGGMEQNVSSSASQVSVLVDFQERQAAGTVVTLRDKEGNELYKGTGEKDFQTIVLSLPEMAAGGEYEIEAGGNVISFTPEETIVYVNQDGIQEAAAMRPGRGGQGGGRGRMGEGREDLPEDWKEGDQPNPPKEGKGRTKPSEGEESPRGPKPPEGEEGQESPKI